MEDIILILFGVIFGYFVIAVTESISHGTLLHASGDRREFWTKFGKVSNYFLDSWYSHHVVHHYKTFRTNYVTMFDNKEHEVSLRDTLIRNGKEQVVLDSYGLRIGSFYKKIQYLYTHVIQIALISYFGGPWVTLGLLIPICFYVWVAEYVHPYIHLPYSVALESAGPLMRVFLKTSYFKFLTRHHFLHHKYVNCNFNLMLGGDVFWGKQRRAIDADFNEMNDLGLCMPKSFSLDTPVCDDRI